MFNRMKALLPGLAAGLLLGVAASLSTAQAAGEFKPVRYAYITGVTDAIVPLLGEEVGIYEKYGIKLDKIVVGGGTASAAALVSNSADVTHTSAATIFPAIQQGAGIKFLMYNYDIDYQLIIQSDADLPNAAAGYPKSVEDLKGKTIGVGGRGGGSERYVNKMAADAGFAPSEVTFIVVGTGVSAVAAFKNRQVDALVALPPSPTLIGADNFKDVVDLNTTRTKVYNENFLFTAFSAGNAFIEKDPELAQNFCRATREAIEFIRDPANTDAVTKFLSAYMNLPTDQSKDIVVRYRENFRAALTPEMWKGMSAFSKDVPAWETSVYEPCARIASE